MGSFRPQRIIYVVLRNVVRKVNNCLYSVIDGRIWWFNVQLEKVGYRFVGKV